jgi:hemerythrin-like domain-containing protein
VRELFDRYEAARSLDAKRTIFRQIRGEVEAHGSIEEQVFYPALRADGGAEARALVRDAGEAHGEIESLLADVAGVADATAIGPEGAEAAMDDRVADLRVAIERHVAEEEDEILPLAEDRLGDLRLEDLGRRMLSMKPAVPA